MFLRQRTNEDHASMPGGSGTPSGSNVERMRQSGESLFQAADDAINRALSGDSLAFLNATQQEGGQ